MLLKTAILFLAAMAIIGLIGSKLFPGAISRGVKNRLLPRNAPRCGRCGRYLVGKENCGCRGKG